MSLMLGKTYENLAKKYLIQQGLKFINSNYRTKLGEIDLIMQDGKALVFVEVKARSGDKFGLGMESVTYSKKNKLIKTATLYLLSNYNKFIEYRFDIISIDGNEKNISWIKNAFYLEN